MDQLVSTKTPPNGKGTAMPGSLTAPAKSTHGTGKPGSLVGDTAMPDPVPPVTPGKGAGKGLVASSGGGGTGTETAAKSPVPGLVPPPGFVVPEEILPQTESAEAEDNFRPMPADCQASSPELEEILLAGRAQIEPPKRPNASLEGELEFRRWKIGKRLRKFGSSLLRRVRKGQGLGNGLILGAAADALEAAQSGGVLEVQIGVEDRVLVDPTTVSPYSGCTQLDIETVNGSGYVGTATIVGITANATVLLTAAHCVYYHENGGFAHRVTATPGRNGYEFPFGRYEIEPGAGIGEILVPQEWIDTRSRSHDYALIIVPEVMRSAGGEVPHVYGYEALEDGDLHNLLCQFTGYPVNLNNPLMDSTLQFYNASRISNFSATNVEHQADSNGGQSGMAIYVGDAGTGECNVIAVHTMGASTGNSGVRLRPEMVAQFDTVIQSLG